MAKRKTTKASSDKVGKEPKKPKTPEETQAAKEQRLKNKAAQSAANTRAQAYIDKFNSSPECADNKQTIEEKCRTPTQAPDVPDKGKPTTSGKLGKHRSGVVSIIADTAQVIDSAIKEAYVKGGYKPIKENAWLGEHCPGLWVKPSTKKLEQYGEKIKEALTAFKNARTEMMKDAAARLFDLAKEKLTPGFLAQKVGGMAVRSVVKEALAGILAPTGIGLVGSAALTAWTVKDVVETATELATAIGPEGLAILAEITELQALEKTVSGLLDNYNENPMAAAADAQRIMARLNACVMARRCQLVPYGNTDSLKAAKTGKGCCPGQTGHHLLPNEMFKDCPEYTKQVHEAAPTVCVEGVNNSHGSHGKIHREMDELMNDHKRDVGDDITTNQAINEAVKAHKRTFPGCNEDCLKQQLHVYYDGMCNGQIKARAGMGKKSSDEEILEEI